MPKSFMNDPRWYKDAVIYELHVRSFFDATDDGVGDFEGLRQKLPYLESLGVNTLWLLPFLESPLKDDGYDISDYYSVLDMHGTLDDFQHFLDEAHERDMRVITELVLNHTSDQHPWFREARDPQSDKHDWYVWSETTEKYEDVRIIFTDTEHSNWNWDQKAGKYYWHRFFSHQPDLNYDNPAVREKMKEVMFYWFDMGVDGLRLDAVPYLFEREGTNSENLPETIDYVKELRAAVDERYGPGKVLLAEANQWPEETLPYFGAEENGDGQAESTGVQMAFNFPIMPRMYMALRRENRRPLVEMLELTGEIPEDAQWAIFLRNHDELTLEMVTDEERDYMYHEYAADRRFRINVGIRRRLAPLLGGERRRIELMNALLMSLKGSPILYYGDEIGMGDDPFLGDRDGVRTPMQWSPDKNGGFSRAPHHRLFKPPINRGPYSYEFVNVEDAEQDEHSLLHFTRRLLALRNQHAQVFGRGTFELVAVENQAVLAFLREYEGKQVLVVANLSRYAQSAHLPAEERLAGLVPVELFGKTSFPPIGREQPIGREREAGERRQGENGEGPERHPEPYHLVLAPHGFYWFALRSEQALIEEAERRRRVQQEEHPGALPMLEVEDGVENLLVPTMARGRGPERFESLLPDYVSKQRWFGSKGTPIERVSVEDAVRLQAEPYPVYLTLIGVHLGGDAGETVYYALPLAVSYEDAEERLKEWSRATIAWIDGPRGRGLLHDATVRRDFWHTLFEWWKSGGRGRSLRGVYESRLADAARGAEPEDIRLLTGEQSNTAAVINGRFFVKLYRRLEQGPHPEPEMLEYLTESGFSFVPQLLGSIEFRRGRQASYPLGLLQEALPVEADGWHYALDVAERFFDRVAGQKLPEEAHLPGENGFSDDPAPAWLEEVAPELLSMAHVLGVRTAEMHRRLAEADAPDLRPQQSTAADADALADRVRESLERTRPMIEDAAENMDLGEGALPAEDGWQRAKDRLEALRERELDGIKIRIHGDYHLGQVLRADGEFYILDFEGEPARTIEERRRRDFPVRDVAGMMRSFDYAARSELMAFREREEAAEAASGGDLEDGGSSAGEAAAGDETASSPASAATASSQNDAPEDGSPSGADRDAEAAAAADEALDDWTEALVRWCQLLFLDGYGDTATGAADTDAAAADTSADGEGEETAPLLSDLDEHRLLLWAYLLDKALYEVRYELNHRPSWMGLPLRGLKRLLAEPADDGRPKKPVLL
jgi:maltose alpha-D-glucosyltransferase/alpha-amylase